MTVNLFGVNLADRLHKSLLHITERSDLGRLPYGSVIVAGVMDHPGIHTLIKIDQGMWRSFSIYGNPSTIYEIEEEEEYTPDVPALLVLCGDQLPEAPTIERHFVLIKGGASEELDSPVERDGVKPGFADNSPGKPAP